MKIKNIIPALMGAALLTANVAIGQITNGDFSTAGPAMPTTEVANSWFVNDSDPNNNISEPYRVATVSAFPYVGRVVYVTGSFLGMNNGSPFIGVDGVNSHPTGGTELEIFRQTGISIAASATTLTFEAAARSGQSVDIQIWLNGTSLGTQTLNSTTFTTFSMPVSGQTAGASNTISIVQASFDGNGRNDFGIDNIQICGDCEVNSDIIAENECNPVYFYSTGSGATNYFWDFGDGTSSTFENPIHQYADPGSYTVTLLSYVSDACGTCCDVTTIDIDVECGEFTEEAMTWNAFARIKSTNNSEMEQKLTNDLSVYPNPTNDILNVSFMLQKTEAVSLEIYSSTGQLVSTIMNNKVSDEGAVNLNLETQSLPAGIYHIVMSTNSERKTKSFVVSE